MTIVIYHRRRASKQKNKFHIFVYFMISLKFINSFSFYLLIHLFSDLPQSILRVLFRSVYTLNLVAILFQMFSVLSLEAFGPKYIENQFKIPTWQADIILGKVQSLNTFEF